jgi:2-succinyl-5-enolpyruvyl-6-hydroxy-3-cyclohexene-1-carboxylate synthase
MNDPVEYMIESNTWQTQVYAICDHYGIKYPDIGEWSNLKNTWEPGKKARASVEELVTMRNEEEEQDADPKST